MYTDATRALQTISLDGHQYYFIAHDYNSNYIFTEPIKDVKDAMLVEAFQKVFETLEDCGMKPTLNITNNQAVKPIKTGRPGHQPIQQIRSGLFSGPIC